MAFFKKKPDPISDRARALNDEIAALESQIKKLDSKLHQDSRETKAESRASDAPRLRSTAIPHGETIQRGQKPETQNAPAAPKRSEGGKPETRTEPIFEEVDQNRLKARSDAASTPDHYNELGVRKYDLPALIQRIKNHFRGPTTTNPKLVNYLAAGGVQGLRPMRYEKRVARNRVIALAVFLFLIGLGIFIVFVKHR
ncbi:MAG: hypothetical protein QOD03_48 [Verrucomicrobiota bacterium]|jgi:hypothetical protein